MEYAKLKLDGSYDYQITTHGNIEWDETHLCPASTLTLEEAELYRVVPLIEVAMPEFNPNTHKCFRDGAEIINNKWHYKWAIVELTEDELAAELAKTQKAALIQINTDDNKIYADVIGNKTTEYLDAAADAKAFKLAGYLEESVPASVKSWADAKLWTNQQAADDIIAQEAAWKYAANLIRQYRLKAKEDVKRALLLADAETAMAIWNGFVVQIRAQLGVA